MADSYTCPRCGQADLISVWLLTEAFERWYCGCGAGGWMTAQGPEVAELPAPGALTQPAPHPE